MNCRALMKPVVACISPSGTAATAAQRMRDANIGFLPICDDDAHVVGTLTDRDVAIRIVADGRDADTLVSDVMTREIVCCRPDDTVEAAEELMAKHHKSRILCCDDDGRLVGVLSLSDLARADPDGAARALREIAEREAHSMQ